MTPKTFMEALLAGEVVECSYIPERYYWMEGDTIRRSNINDDYFPTALWEYHIKPNVFHIEERAAFKDGKRIAFLNKAGVWTETNNPKFLNDTEYKIIKDKKHLHNHYIIEWSGIKVKTMYKMDGLTGDISAEVIK